jgi:hypothetical protein
MEFNIDAVKAWMEANGREIFDEELFAGQEPANLLAEGYCNLHGCEEWLDDENHPIWEVASDLATNLVFERFSPEIRNRAVELVSELVEKYGSHPCYTQLDVAIWLDTIVRGGTPLNELTAEIIHDAMEF